MTGGRRHNMSAARLSGAHLHAPGTFARLESSGLWEQRPTRRDWCVVTPTYKPHFSLTLELLKSFYLYAVDAVPIYVVLDDPRAAREWKTCMSLAVKGLGGWAVPSHHTLDLATMANLSIPQLAGKIKSAGLPRTCQVGVSWATNNRQWGHLKKLLALREVGQQRGCKAAWVLDAESRPLRVFRFDEIFSRLRMLLVRNVSIREETGLQPPSSYTRVTNECLELATAVHNVPVSPAWVGHGLQENDFWLYSTDDFMRMVADTMARGTRSFVDALLQSKSLESSVIFNTYVLERLVTPGAPAADPTATTGDVRQPLAAAGPVLPSSRLEPALLPKWWWPPPATTDGEVATDGSSMQASRDSDNHQLLPRYSIVAADVGTFKSCGLDLSHSSNRPEHSSWWSHRQRASEPALNCSCLGAKVYQLGQAGLRGDFVFPYKWNPVQIKSHLRLSASTCLPGLAQHVPW